MTEPYSDLRVDSQQQYPKQAISVPHQAEANSRYTYSDKIAFGVQPQVEDVGVRQRKRICGLVAKKFWIVAAIIVFVVIAVAVGGGVGGSLVGKSNSATSAAATTSTQATTSSSTSPASSNSSAALVTSSASPTMTTISISTSTTIGPSETLLVDCPSSNNTVYSVPSTDQLWRKVCANSYAGDGDNLVNQATSSLNNCISLCAAYNVANAGNICNAVCWRATITGDDYPGTCFGGTTTNISGSFVYGHDLRCDGAALINANA